MPAIRTSRFRSRQRPDVESGLYMDTTGSRASRFLFSRSHIFFADVCKTKTGHAQSISCGCKVIHQMHERLSCSGFSQSAARPQAHVDSRIFLCVCRRAGNHLSLLAHLHLRRCMLRTPRENSPDLSRTRSRRNSLGPAIAGFLRHTSSPRRLAMRKRGTPGPK